MNDIQNKIKEFKDIMDKYNKGIDEIIKLLQNVKNTSTIRR